MSNLHCALRRYFSSFGCQGTQHLSSATVWLFEVAEEIVYEIIVHWCGELKDLINMDISFCNHQHRRLLLHLLSSYDMSALLATAADAKLIAAHVDYMHWIRSRKLSLSSLAISMRSLASKRGARSFRSLSVHGLRSLHLCASYTGNNKDKSLSTEHWRRLFRCCGALLELELSTRCAAQEVLLSAASAYCRSLQVLRLSYQPISLTCIASLGGWGSSLLGLHLQHCELADAQLRILLARIPLLLALSLVSCSLLSAHSLAVILQSLPGLQQLQFSLPRAVDAGSLDGQFPLSLSLRSLDLPLKGLSMDFVAKLVASCPHLHDIRTLRLSVTEDRAGYRSLLMLDPRALPRDQLEGIFARFGGTLQLVDVTDMTADQVLCLLLTCSSQLTSLKLVRCVLTDAAVDLLATRCPQLQALHLFACAGLCDKHIDLLTQHCKHVSDCRIPGSALVSDAAAELLKSWPLQQLDVCRCAQFSDVGIFAVMQGCPQLRQLFATHTKVSVRMLKLLQQRYHLHTSP